MPITKKHKSIVFAGMALMTGATLFTGCSSEPILADKSEQYTRDFIKTFGAFDQSHDWNHATQTSVTVTTAAPTEVKVMADFEGKRYIFASFTNVEGRHTLNVDIPKGITDLIVAANGKNYNVKAGGEVSLTTRSSRTFGSPETTGPFTFSITNEPKSFPVEAIDNYINAMSEDAMNIGKEINGKVLTSNFHLEGKGLDHPITFYPLYWNTSSYHALGIYWLNEDGKLDASCMKDLYYTRSGELEYLEKGKNADESFEDIYVTCWNSTDLNIGDLCPKHGNLPTLQTTDPIKAYEWDATTNQPYQNTYSENYTDPHHHVYRKILAPAEWSHVENGQQASYNISNVSMIRSKGITLAVEEGVKYGFYIKVAQNNSINPDRPKLTEEEKAVLEKQTSKNSSWENSFDYYEKDGVTYYEDDVIYHIVFSQELRNKQYGTELGVKDIFNCLQQNHISGQSWVDKSSSISSEHSHVQAAYLSLPIGDKTYTYFSFEDWKLAGPDLNDLVFIFDEEYTPNDIPVVDEDKPEPEVGEWEWVIACEDLGTNDFDFNDVVFSVSWPKTDVQSGVKTVKVKALAAGGTLPVYLYYKDNVLHPDGESDSSEFHKWFGTYGSNQVINAASIRADGKTATVTVDGDFTMACTTKVENGNMGGFKVKVEHSENPAIIGAANPNVSEEIGTAPQMICVPANWCWPKENVFIRNVYTEFHNWCADQGEIHWHDSHAGTGYWDPDGKCKHTKK